MNLLMKKNKICVVTSSRADYGLLKPLIIKFSNSEFFKLQLVVTGSHLSKNHGYTVNEIIDDNIPINKKIEIINKTNTIEDIGKISANAFYKMIDVLSELKPQIVLILGDRYEILSCALASTFLHIPVAHIHGGEITEGAIDDMLRHAITKLSQIHFTSNIVHKRRVIQMGEQPKNVFNVGSLGVENLKNLKLLNLDKLQKQIDFKFRKKNLLITYHPVSLDENPNIGIDILLKSLSNFSETGMIFTFANADIKGEYISQRISKFAKNNDNVKLIHNLGQINYFSCLRYCDGMVGNSSSGIIEAPSMNKWSINIGNRQKGRLKANSVFDVEINEEKITKQLNFLLEKSLKIPSSDFINPYSKKNTSSRIYEIIKSINTENIFKKQFFDINF